MGDISREAASVSAARSCGKNAVPAIDAPIHRAKVKLSLARAIHLSGGPAA
jgi:hypothetical protein